MVRNDSGVCSSKPPPKMVYSHGFFPHYCHLEQAYPCNKCFEYLLAGAERGLYHQENPSGSIKISHRLKAIRNDSGVCSFKPPPKMVYPHGFSPSNCHLEQTYPCNKCFEYLLAGAERGLSQEAVQSPVPSLQSPSLQWSVLVCLLRS